MTPVPPPLPEQMSETDRLAGVFFSPRRAFTDIARRPRWWIPMIIIGVVTAVGIITFSQHVGWERVIRKTLEQNASAQNMTGEQRERVIELYTRFLPLLAVVAPIGAALTIVLIAAVLIFLTNTLMGAEISFPSMMGIVGYGGIPPALVTTALTILVMYLKNPDDFDIQNPLAFNAGAFLPDGTAKWIVALCGSLDLFSFWRIGLLAIGISAAAPKISFGKALFAVMFPWLLWVAIRTALASLSG